MKPWSALLLLLFPAAPVLPAVDAETVNHLDWARYVWTRRAQALEAPGANR